MIQFFGVANNSYSSLLKKRNLILCGIISATPCINSTS